MGISKGSSSSSSSSSSTSDEDKKSVVECSNFQSPRSDVPPAIAGGSDDSHVEGAQRRAANSETPESESAGTSEAETVLSVETAKFPQNPSQERPVAFAFTAVPAKSPNSPSLSSAEEAAASERAEAKNSKHGPLDIACHESMAKDLTEEAIREAYERMIASEEEPAFIELDEPTILPSGRRGHPLFLLSISAEPVGYFSPEEVARLKAAAEEALVEADEKDDDLGPLRKHSQSTPTVLDREKESSSPSPPVESYPNKTTAQAASRAPNLPSVDEHHEHEEGGATPEEEGPKTGPQMTGEQTEECRGTVCTSVDNGRTAEWKQKFSETPIDNAYIVESIMAPNARTGATDVPISSMHTTAAELDKGDTHAMSLPQLSSLHCAGPATVDLPTSYTEIPVNYRAKASGELQVPSIRISTASADSHVDEDPRMSTQADLEKSQEHQESHRTGSSYPLENSRPLASSSPRIPSCEIVVREVPVYVNTPPDSPVKASFNSEQRWTSPTINSSNKTYGSEQQWTSTTSNTSSSTYGSEPRWNSQSPSSTTFSSEQRRTASTGRSADTTYDSEQRWASNEASPSRTTFTSGQRRPPRTVAASPRQSWLPRAVPQTTMPPPFPDTQGDDDRSSPLPLYSNPARAEWFLSTPRGWSPQVHTREQGEDPIRWIDSESIASIEEDGIGGIRKHKHKRTRFLSGGDRKAGKESDHHESFRSKLGRVIPSFKSKTVPRRSKSSEAVATGQPHFPAPDTEFYEEKGHEGQRLAYRVILNGNASLSNSNLSPSEPLHVQTAYASDYSVASPPRSILKYRRVERRQSPSRTSPPAKPPPPPPITPPLSTSSPHAPPKPPKHSTPASSVSSTYERPLSSLSSVASSYTPSSRISSISPASTSFGQPKWSPVGRPGSATSTSTLHYSSDNLDNTAAVTSEHVVVPTRVGRQMAERPSPKATGWRGPDSVQPYPKDETDSKTKEATSSDHVAAPVMVGKLTNEERQRQSPKATGWRGPDRIEPYPKEPSTPKSKNADEVAAPTIVGQLTSEAPRAAQPIQSKDQAKSTGGATYDEVAASVIVDESPTHRDVLKSTGWRSPKEDKSSVSQRTSGPASATGTIEIREGKPHHGRYTKRTAAPRSSQVSEYV